MRLPLLSGIIADESAEFLASYPVNLETVPVDNKIAKAQFRMTAGATTFGPGGPGPDRGGFMWRGVLHRVMGTRLVTIGYDGTYLDHGDVGGSGPVTFAEGFDRIALRSGTKLFYYAGAIEEVTDVALGPVLDLIWIDGYFMTTDGTSIVVTELNDQTSILPLKYGSAEEDPDMVTGLIKIRDEACALGRYTIQFFQNIGGNGFPFAVVKSATIPVGCVGPAAKCLYGESFAFVGSAHDEALGVYLAGPGTATRISTRAIDDELARVTDPSTIILENRSSRAERRLLVHLPDKTLVFLLNASKALGEPVWYVAQSGAGKPYRIRNAVQAYSETIVGDLSSNALGILTDDVATHFGENAEWRFDVGLLYNQGKGGVIFAVELIGLPGRAPAGVVGTAFLSMTRDGETFSVERAIPMGTSGQRSLRLQWRPRVNFRNWIGLRFRGYSAAMPGFAACEADVRPLAA